MVAQKVMFRPRRLAHANLFVNELERSMKFYTKVCGLSEVFREPPIKAGFLSNGSSHHDVALIEVSDRTRRGGDGTTIVARGRGSKAGLNHFGWEMENEAVLVEAYNRATDCGLKIHRLANHQVSHSVYIFDPEGNYNEFYADASDNWRDVWRPGNTDVLTVKWQPENADKSEKPRYESNPELVSAADAMIPSEQIGHAVLVADEYESLLDFYKNVAGLDVSYTGSNGSYAVLTGPLGRSDLVVLPSVDGRSPGMHHVGFEVQSELHVEEAEERLRGMGITIEASVDSSSKRSFFIQDPDGIRLEFYAGRDNSVDDMANPYGLDIAYLL